LNISPSRTGNYGRWASAIIMVEVHSGDGVLMSEINVRAPTRKPQD